MHLHFSIYQIICLKIFSVHGHLKVIFLSILFFTHNTLNIRIFLYREVFKFMNFIISFFKGIALGIGAIMPRT